MPREKFLQPPSKFEDQEEEPDVEDDESFNPDEIDTPYDPYVDPNFEVSGTPYIPDSAEPTQLWHHRGGNFGNGTKGFHRNGTHGHHRNGTHHHDKKGKSARYGGGKGKHQKDSESKMDKFMKPNNPYRDWLDKLPYMDKDVARAQAQ